MYFELERRIIFESIGKEFFPVHPSCIECSIIVVGTSEAEDQWLNTVDESGCK